MRRLRVLLVEDSLLLQDVLGEMLKEIENVEIAAQAQGGNRSVGSAGVGTDRSGNRRPRIE